VLFKKFRIRIFIDQHGWLSDMNRDLKILFTKALIISGLLVLLAAVLPTRVRAQDGTPPAMSPGSWKGEVTGSITNGTSGAPVSETVEVMLHGWNDSEEKIMLHGQSAPDGSFRFEDVDFDPGLFYAAMATYKVVAYYSEPAQVKEGDLKLSFNTPVYETTDDLSLVKIDQMHVLFYAHEGQLMVTEVFILSNAGNLTVKDTLTLPSGRKGSLEFPLPDDATNVEFDAQSTDRYIQVDGGFVDTAPLAPGEKNSQVMVRYSLPYTGKYAFEFTAPVAVGGVSFLIPEESGLKLQSSSLTPAGTRPMEDETSFAIYTSPGLSPAESIEVSLSGRLKKGISSFPGSKDFGLGIAVGGSLLGLSLLGVGVWWWRRSREEENTEMSLEDIRLELEQLDEAYARGEVLEDEYQETRAELRAEVKLAAGERDGDNSELT
jgi:hypothetical protein